jgi:hypothetical protein
VKHPGASGPAVAGTARSNTIPASAVLLIFPSPCFDLGLAAAIISQGEKAG